MGLLDCLNCFKRTGKTTVKTRYYEVSNGDGVHNYVLGNFFRGNDLIDRYWQPVDSEGNPAKGTSPDRRIQCISSQSYNEILRKSMDNGTVNGVQQDLERLAEKTTPEYNGEGVLVRIAKTGNQLQMIKIGNAKPWN